MLTRHNPRFPLAINTAFGVIASLLVLLGGCTNLPRPAKTATPPTATPVAAKATTAPVAVALATQPAATATQAASPTLPPTPTPLPSPTATATALPPTATHTAVPPTATPTPTRALPTATARPVVPASATPVVIPIKERIWDPRLTQRGAVLVPAQVPPGQGYWRLVQAQWFDVNDPPFAGKYHIFVEALDQAGKRQTNIRFEMASSITPDIYGHIITEAKAGEPYAGSFPMFIAAPAYRIAPADGSPADSVTGLGLGTIAFPQQADLTSYGFTWQWTVVGQAIPTATPMASGANPNQALPLPVEGQRLVAGQRIWYAFRYAGDNSEFVIQMRVNPSGAANFALWTTADVERWAQNNSESPVGRGTPNAAANGDLVWIGGFNIPGIYYITADQTGPYVGSFSLRVSGPGISPAGGSK